MAKKKLTAVVIDALEDIKARDIVLINVTKLTSVFDYIAVASADSSRQTKALAKNVMDKVKEAGGWIYGTEGESSGEWVLVDCGDVVVHIMQPAVREHYQLEALWGEGKIEFPKPVRAKPKTADTEDAPTASTAKKAATRKPRTASVAKKPAAGTRSKTTTVTKKVAESKKTTTPKAAAKKPRAKTSKTKL